MRIIPTWRLDEIGQLVPDTLCVNDERQYVCVTPRCTSYVAHDGDECRTCRMTREWHVDAGP